METVVQVLKVLGPFLIGSGGTLLVGFFKWFKPVQKALKETAEAVAAVDKARDEKSPGGKTVTREEAAEIGPELYDVYVAVEPMVRPLVARLRSRLGKAAETK